MTSFLLSVDGARAGGLIYTGSSGFDTVQDVQTLLLTLSRPCAVL